MPDYMDDDEWTEVRYRRGRKDYRVHNLRPQRIASYPPIRRRDDRKANSHINPAMGPPRARPLRSYADAVAGNYRSASPVYRDNYNRVYNNNNYHHYDNQRYYTRDFDDRRYVDQRREDHSRGRYWKRAPPAGFRRGPRRRRDGGPSAGSTSERRRRMPPSRSRDERRNSRRRRGRRPSSHPPADDNRAGVRQDRDDSSFKRQVRLLHRLIKSIHHLKNVGDFDKPPSNITKMANTLTAFIKPASITDRTQLLIEGNAKNWAHTACLILKEHYTESVEQEILSIDLMDWQNLEAPFDIAVIWARRNLGRRLLQSTVDHARELIKARLTTSRTHENLVTETPVDQRPTMTQPPSTQVEVLPTPSLPADQRDDQPDVDCIPPTPEQTVAVETHLVCFEPQPGEEPSSLLDSAHLLPHLLSTSSPLTASGSPPPSPTSVLDMTIGEINALYNNFSESNVMQGVETPKEQRQTSLQPRRITRATHLQAEAAASSSSETSVSCPPLPPIPHICKPFRHRNTNNKLVDWKYEVKGQFLIIGDSNVDRFSDVDAAGLQMDSFPGGTFFHAGALLSQLTTDVNVHTVILSFGINSRASDPHAGPILHLEETLKKARKVFPRANILVPLINYSSALPDHERSNLDAFNEYLRDNCTCSFIPALPHAQFCTSHDKVHWTFRTARSMLSHWFQHLKGLTP